MRKRTAGPAVILALIATMAGTAHGDDIGVDDDIAIVNAVIDYGDICVDSAGTETAYIRAKAGASNPNNTFANGTNVLVSVDAVTGTGVAAVMVDGVIDLTPDGDWQSKSTGLSSEAATATITVPTTSVGAITGSVRFLAKATRVEPLSGTGLDPYEVRRLQTVTLSGNVIVCNTAPELTVPDDITVDPDSASGASVAWLTSATDAEDDPDPTPVCTVGAAVVTSPHTFGFGATTVTCTATDNGGLSDEESFLVTVNDFGFDGFYAPVNNDALNTIKGGQTVPLKFDVSGAGGEFSDIAVVDTLKQTEFKCPTATDDVPEDPVEATVTGGTTLRWDATGQQFIFNWKSPTTKNRCYKVVLTTDDHEAHTLEFKTKG